jgi:hypothetical protein
MSEAWKKNSTDSKQKLELNVTFDNEDVTELTKYYSA